MYDIGGTKYLRVSFNGNVTHLAQMLASVIVMFGGISVSAPLHGKEKLRHSGFASSPAMSPHPTKSDWLTGALVPSLFITKSDKLLYGVGIFGSNTATISFDVRTPL